MLKRWLLRGILVVPILLGLAGWAWSYGHAGDLWYLTATGTVVRAQTGRGSLGVDWQMLASFDPAVRGWHFQHGVLAPSNRRVLVVWDDRVVCGFEWRTDALPRGTWRRVQFPYYALLLPLAAALVLVWRKTRPPRQGRAFPVETSAAAKNAS